MSVFESLIYGVVSGFSEFLPVSSQGQQALLLWLFGADYREPIRDLIVHIAVLISLLVACRPLMVRLRREQLISTRRRGRHTANRRGLYELRLIKTAAFPLIVGLFFYVVTREYETDPLRLILFFALNGLVLIVPEYIRHGNKDARFMTGWDGVLLGILGAVSVLPGLSRIGTMNAYTLARGADRQQSINWILLLSIPALIFFIGFDVYQLFTVTFGGINFSVILGYLLSGLSAFVGGYFSIILIRFLTVRTGFAGFAYYSWGMAAFTFVLYLIA